MVVDRTCVLDHRNLPYEAYLKVFPLGNETARMQWRSLLLQQGELLQRQKIGF